MRRQSNEALLTTIPEHGCLLCACCEMNSKRLCGKIGSVEIFDG